MTAEQEAAIMAWLAWIGETDAATLAEVISECRRFPDARDYFGRRAAADLPQPDPFPDDRRTCNQCANLSGGRCQAARRGEIATSRDHQPIPNQLKRCSGYAPRVADPDQRPGRDRWPGLK